MGLTLEHLARAAELVGGLQPGELQGRESCREVVTVRQAVMWLATKRQGASAAGTARFLRRDHTTVIYGIRCVAKRLYMASTETNDLIEAIWAAAHVLANGGQVQVAKPIAEVKANPPPPPKETKREALKHWSAYPICSPQWYAANDQSFKLGMIKARARVFAEAGE